MQMPRYFAHQKERYQLRFNGERLSRLEDRSNITYGLILHKHDTVWLTWDASAREWDIPAGFCRHQELPQGTLTRILVEKFAPYPPGTLQSVRWQIAHLNFRIYKPDYFLDGNRKLALWELPVEEGNWFDELLTNAGHWYCIPGE